jgi:uncharacterized protein (DUF1684 family)
MRRDDLVRAVERALSRLGITDYEFAHRGSTHRAVIIRHRGQERFVVFSNTSRNWFASRNAAGDVRRAIRAIEESAR